MIHIPPLLYFYGIFLVCCGIASVVFIGPKAKTALISGGTSGVISALTGWLVSMEIPGAQLAGIAVSLALFCVFAWRSAKTLFKVLELVSAGEGQEHVTGKAVAFLIISLMAAVSVVVLILQILFYNTSNSIAEF